eukprot:g23017.t1
MVPSYACLFMGYVEHSLFQTYSGPHPQLFLQYVNDIISAASLSQPELEKLIDFASNFYPALIFTWSISDTSFLILNISVSISGDRMPTNIHHKPTDSHSYLDYTSSHPTSCKDSALFSQFLRLHHICSSESNFDKAASKMPTFFLNQGFSSTVVDRALNRVQPISHTSTLIPSLPSRNNGRIPLNFIDHPTSNHIQKIIRCHFHHLQQDATTRHIFPSTPLSAFRRDCSFWDTLVHTSITPNTSPQPYGTFPCNRRRCNTC